MDTAYLNRVLIYLQQELPENYREHIQLTGEKLVIAVPHADNFQQVYEDLHQTIISCVGRIRNRDIDLEFIIKSQVQERYFKILK
ncbi:MAG: hypothetical protein JWP67_1806 [Mucilaginibacter sp.]|nr:hypothetical protein [Mucilaginibacter sp.]